MSTMEILRDTAWAVIIVLILSAALRQADRSDEQ